LRVGCITRLPWVIPVPGFPISSPEALLILDRKILTESTAPQNAVVMSEEVLKGFFTKIIMVRTDWPD